MKVRADGIRFTQVRPGKALFLHVANHLRAPFDLRRDKVGYIGLYTSDMSQTRGFHSLRYRYNIYKVTAHGRLLSQQV